MDKGFEEQSRRLETAMNGLVEDLDKTHLRKMHADMHTCAARCCQSKDDSLETVYNCVENCRLPVDHAWSFVESELINFHEKLSQCLDQCNAKSKWMSQNSEVQLTRSTKEMEDCTTRCVDQMINALPKVAERMKQNLNRSSMKRAAVFSNLANEDL
ncbi:protein FAM136A-like [Lycorma delicatula]|uniref:protein FAM136A-like n=1 Tax=Lycorma delicatula TaxID=130591 RepID=UPI003F518EFC